VTDERALPVVYLPGASGRAAVWRPIAERLAKRRTPVLVDYPGLGDAPLEPEIRDLTDLCHVVVRGLPARFDLVALSMGAAIALRIAVLYPERVRRLVLATVAGGLDVAPFGAIDVRPALRGRRPDAPSWFLDDSVELTERLGAITASVLLVFGGQDLVAPPAVGEFLREKLPSARLEIIENGTHDLEAEHPDLLASLIEAHFRR
jgi:poly(3-hydroxyoctanoate) depolymerase